MVLTDYRSNTGRIMWHFQCFYYAGICSAMGERPVHVRQFDQKAVSLKEELARVCPELEEMQERKSERRNQFIEVQEQIQSITNEIYSPSITAAVDETDLSLRKLEEFQTAFCISKGEEIDSAVKYVVEATESGKFLDENRYNAGRGSYLTLKRAKKACALVKKLPAMVDALTSKTVASEKDKGIEFTYDGTCLVCMLENYSLSRQEKEQERCRQWELKKLQGQIIVEKEKMILYRILPTTLHDDFLVRLYTKECFIQFYSVDVEGGSQGHISAARRGEYCWCSYEKILYRCWKCVPDVVSPLTRQPFCPISSTVSSKANVAFAANDTHNEKLQKTLVVSNFPSITTSKTTTVVDKRTKLQRAVSIPDPTTP
ncbi:hypothetical protein JHK85_046456 [Glycine max]|nr:hypothetical protein JHK85_046456 [Glycine max]